MSPRMRPVGLAGAVALVVLTGAGCALKDRLFARRDVGFVPPTEELVLPLMLPQAIEDDVETGRGKDRPEQGGQPGLALRE